MKKFLFAFVFLAMTFPGCNPDNSITESESAQYDSTIPLWKKAINEQNLDMVKIPVNSTRNLAKTLITQTALPDNKTVINLEYQYTSVNNEDVKIKLQLTIPAGALDEETDITVSMDEEYLMTDLSVGFGPSGTVFNIPAELDLSAVGLEIEGDADLTNLKFVYFDKYSSTWEELSVEKLFVKTNNGLLVCKNGEIPHFSRFGFIR